ncbi:MAG: hypothetical protein N2559_17370 [Anaerolineae bacterium]|nr:hypothetical protein [Anaerolineae bacterium]
MIAILWEWIASAMRLLYSVCPPLWLVIVFIYFFFDQLAKDWGQDNERGKDV